ncbi:alpha/beta hydrolase family protein [Nocardia sp. BMG111209]|uniref:alpha/beta hydrolase n=1 Tax=Nocardia sp. BMG111209 TaxID=1160137 RepID=UPI001E3501C7|nr:alpha/beta hydrolase family protein [Nocardia sp. BMG111209]
MSPDHGMVGRPESIAARSDSSDTERSAITWGRTAQHAIAGSPDRAREPQRAVLVRRRVSGAHRKAKRAGGDAISRMVVEAAVLLTAFGATSAPLATGAEPVATNSTGQQIDTEPAIPAGESPEAGPAPGPPTGRAEIRAESELRSATESSVAGAGSSQTESPPTGAGLSATSAMRWAAAIANGSAADAESPGDGQPPALDPDIDRTELVGVEHRSPRWDRLLVASASMHRIVPVDILHGSSAGTPRPTLYLLDGVDGEPTSGWLTKGGAERYFGDKPVDVVLTSGGVGSMYSDWDNDDPVLGLNRWETFLVDELPPIAETYLGSDGRRAIAGVSMGAQGAMMLAQRHPGFYHAVSGISGCYSTSDQLGRTVTQLTVASRGGDPDNLWGPPTSPEWVAHDTYLGADKLRGTTIHLSVGTGIPSLPDLTAVAAAPDPAAALRLVGGGAALEAGARECTLRFAARLTALHIPYTIDYQPAGTHSWPDFTNQLPATWTAISRSFDTSGPDPADDM